MVPAVVLAGKVKGSVVIVVALPLIIVILPEASTETEPVQSLYVNAVKPPTKVPSALRSKSPADIGKTLLEKLND